MKKILILLSLFIFSINITAQDSTKYVTELNAEKLVDKYAAKFEATIISLAETLKTPAEHVYVVLIKQQRIKAATFILIFVIGLIMLSIFRQQFKHAQWHEKPDYHRSEYKDKEEYDQWCKENCFNKHATLSLISGFTCLIFLLVSLINVDTIMTGLFNPEYGAINSIIDMVK
jgi:zinc transporter ZupT